LSHLSVHDGSTVYSAEIEEVNEMLSEQSYKRTVDGGFWDVQWSLDEAEWPVPEVSCSNFEGVSATHEQKGSARMIVDLLPRVTPVEPIKPTK
jgi:hypothetical protein